ncbi:hypothetical protein [Prosthecomicrobium sp. N25]
MSKIIPALLLAAMTTASVVSLGQARATGLAYAGPEGGPARAAPVAIASR